MILCEPLCPGAFVAGKELSEWTQYLKFNYKDIYAITKDTK